MTPRPRHYRDPLERPYWVDTRYVPAVDHADCDLCGYRIEPGDEVLRNRPDVHRVCDERETKGVDRGELHP